MPKLTLDKFLMGRIKVEDLTPEMKADSADLLDKVNALLADFYKAFPELQARYITSGYRTPEANAAAGGKPKSKHMLCQAVDIADADKKLGQWLTMFPDVLIRHDLYMEAKASTPTWVHLQIIPPKSKKRIFLP